MKFRVDYLDKEGDYHKCWVEASSEEDAKDQAKSEYWNIERITYVGPLN